MWTALRSCWNQLQVGVQPSHDMHVLAALCNCPKQCYVVLGGSAVCDEENMCVAWAMVSWRHHLSKHWVTPSLLVCLMYQPVRCYETAPLPAAFRPLVRHVNVIESV